MAPTTRRTRKQHATTSPVRKLLPKQTTASPSVSPVRSVASTTALLEANTPEVSPAPVDVLPRPPVGGVQDLPSGKSADSVWLLPLPSERVLQELRKSGFALRPSNGNNIVLPEAEIWGRLGMRGVEARQRGERRRRGEAVPKCGYGDSSRRSASMMDGPEVIDLEGQGVVRALRKRARHVDRMEKISQDGKERPEDKLPKRHQLSQSGAGAKRFDHLGPKRIDMPPPPLSMHRAPGPSPETTNIGDRFSSGFPPPLFLISHDGGVFPQAKRVRSRPGLLHRTGQPPHVTAFLSAVTEHYKRCNDQLSPAFFAKLCLDYNSRAIDELGFYVGVLRLLLSSGATHLIEAFRPLLPKAWRAKDLGWLAERVREDVRFQMGIARAKIGMRTGMVDRQVVREDVEDGSADLASDRKKDGRASGEKRATIGETHAVSNRGREEAVQTAQDDVTACEGGKTTNGNPSLVITLRVPKAQLHAIITGETSITQAATSRAVNPDRTESNSQQKANASPHEIAMAEPESQTPLRRKKRPRNGYRAEPVSHLVGITPSSTDDPRPTSPGATKRTPSIRKNKKSLVVVLSPKAARNAPASTTPAPKTAEVAAEGVQVAIRATRATPPTSSATPSSPPRNDKASSSRLPPASSISHLGTVYPTRRAIFSRASKPFVHALCGTRFTHPDDVKRHHNGQSGRPGCWEKQGKEEGRTWDEDASCKVGLRDVKYKEVREGWVVLDWGTVGWLAEKADEEASEQQEEQGSATPGANAADALKSQAKKGIGVARKARDSTRAASEEQNGATPTPKTTASAVNLQAKSVGIKRKARDKTLTTGDDEVNAEDLTANDAKRLRADESVARAAALGLRSRK